MGMEFSIILFFLVFLCFQEWYISYKRNIYSKKINSTSRPLYRTIQLLNRFNRKAMEMQCKVNSIAFLIFAITLHILANIKNYDFDITIYIASMLSFVTFVLYLVCKLIRYLKNKTLKEFRKKLHKNK